MNWSGKLAEIFIKNKNLSFLIMISLFLWGGFSFFLTPKQYNPQITAPSFQVIVEYPGASRNEVVEEVTKPLEHVLANIPAIEDIYSQSEKGGRSILNVNFYVGEDVESAKITLDDRIRSNLHLVPVDVGDPLIRSIDPEDVPVMTIAVRSDKVDAVKLRKFAFRLKDRLQTIDGTSSIGVVGGRRKELSIKIDPFKLDRNGVGIFDIEKALARDNSYLKSGYFKKSDKYIPVEAESNIKNPADLENSIIVSGDYGQIRLHEVAGVTEDVEEISSHVRHVYKSETGNIVESKNVVFLSVSKLNGTNISNVTASVNESLLFLKNTFIPSDIKVSTIVDEGHVAKREIDGLAMNLIMAVIIVVLLLFIFLNKRAALLVAVSIPLTLATVFIIGLLAGQNINRITLFALILSLGLLVDSSTVVIENIVRHLKKDGERRSKEGIVINAVNEVGPGLFMSTVTTILAFVPMAFVTGMMGPYMGPIPFFVPMALIVALLLSLTINPWLASLLLKIEVHKITEDHQKSHFIKEFFSKSGKFVYSIYEKLLKELLLNSRKRRMMLGSVLILIFISLSLPALKFVKFRMLPKSDSEQFFLYVDMPWGTSLEKTFDASVEFEKELLKDVNIKMVQSYVGEPPILDFNGLFRNVSARKNFHQATLRVGLIAPSERDLKSQEIVENLRNSLTEFTSKTFKDNIKLKLVEDPPGPPVLSTMLLKVQGYDEKSCIKTAEDLFPKIKSVSGIVDTDSSMQDDTETVTLKVDHERAFISRISAKRIVRSLRTAFSGSIVGIYHNEHNIEQEYITLRFDKRFRKDPSILKKIYLYNDLRIRVKLSDLVVIGKSKTDKLLMRENGLNTVYFYGDMAGRSITYSAIDILSLLYDYRLSGNSGKLVNFSLFGADYLTDSGKKIRISIGGEWELTLEVFRDLGLAMLVAVLFIYIVLVAQFKSFAEPLLIMSTIPLGLIGVMPGFMILGYINGTYFNATSMIGFIALAGIAVNNSIIFLEYLKSFKGRGLSLVDSIVESGMTRFRPIMLTTVTTMLGSLTIVGDPVWAGLAYALIFGLGVSSLLTLLVFPVLYFLVNRNKWD